MRVSIWGGAFSAEIPDTWEVVELDDVVEVDLGVAALHFSVFRRADESVPVEGEASEFVEDFAGDHVVGPLTEHRVPEGFDVRASYSDHESAARWDVGARISSRRVVVYTYGDDGNHDELREQAQGVFESLVVD